MTPEYRERGFVSAGALFSRAELDLLAAEVTRCASEDLPSTVREADGRTVRALHGSHRESELFDRLTRDGRLVDPAREALDGDVYLYQLKINTKAALTGDAWPFHQDFIFWYEEDSIPEPRMISAMIFLDDVSEENGPVRFIPGSHARGMIRARPRGDEHWAHNVSADLRYQVPAEILAELEGKSSMQSAVGRRGTVYFFHPNVVHGSGPNRSTARRNIVVVTYNCVHNLPQRPLTRPTFLVNRDTTPIRPVPFLR
jgi:ectoine hydroxylase